MAFAKLPAITAIPWNFLKHLKGMTLDTIAVAQTLKATGTLTSSSRTLLTVRQLADRHPAFTQGSLRNLIFLAGNRNTSHGVILGNGLDVALVRIGRKLLIDEAKFFQWIDHQQEAKR